MSFARQRRCLWCRKPFAVRRRHQQFCGRGACRNRWSVYLKDPRTIALVAVDGRTTPAVLPRALPDELQQLRRQIQRVRNAAPINQMSGTLQDRQRWEKAAMALLAQLETVVGELGDQLAPAKASKKHAA